MVIPGDIKDLFDKYALARKGRGTNDLFFVSASGIQPSRLTACVQAFAKEYGVELPCLTTHRKVVGTQASSFNPQQQEKVAAFLKHSLNTQRRYYRNLEATKDTVEAFELVKTITPSPATTGPSPSSSRRFKYSAAEEKLIQTFFQQFIDTSQLPSMNNCRNFLKQNPIANRTAQHIRDKVKTFLRQKQQ